LIFFAFSSVLFAGVVEWEMCFRRGWPGPQQEVQRQAVPLEARTIMHPLPPSKMPSLSWKNWEQSINTRSINTNIRRRKNIESRLRKVAKNTDVAEGAVTAVAVAAEGAATQDR